MKTAAGVPILIIIVIQKQIFSQKKKNFQIPTNWQPVLTKKLNFFFIKKKFFLYKPMKSKLPITAVKEKYRNPTQLDTWYIYKKYINLLKKKTVYLQILTKRKFLKYRLKKKFKNVNKFNRLFFFTSFGLFFGKRDTTQFFIATKNIKKKAIFNSLINKKFVKRPDYRLPGRHFYNYSETAPYLFIRFRNRAGMILSRTTQLLYFRKTNKLNLFKTKTFKKVKKERYKKKPKMRLRRRKVSTRGLTHYKEYKRRIFSKKQKDTVQTYPSHLYDPRQLLLVLQTPQKTTPDENLTNLNMFNIRTHN